MYHPSRGGVRGGSDQFTWDGVKIDKHRENYLGHSVMAPVGRWQKGKDLSWYAKKRKAENDDEKPVKSLQKAIIKKAEDDAMLIALGLKPAKKEEHSLNKEEMAEVLMRNCNELNSVNTERVVRGSIERGSKQIGGVVFEAHPLNVRTVPAEVSNMQDSSVSSKSSESRSAKKLKNKHKKKKRKKQSQDDKHELHHHVKKCKKEKKKHHHHKQHH